MLVGDGRRAEGVEVELDRAEAGDDEDGSGVVGAEPGGDVNATGNSSIDVVGVELPDERLDTCGASHVAVDERQDEPERRVSCLQVAEQRPDRIRQQGELVR